MDKRVDGMNAWTFEMNKTMQGIAEQNINILKDNENMKKFIHFGED